MLHLFNGWGGVGVICLVMVTITGGAHAITPIELGMTLAVRAYDLVCWYEKLRQFPNTDSTGFTRDCFGKGDFVKSQIRDDEMGRIYFGDWMVRLAMDGLPPEYGYACNEYLRDFDKVPAMYEGEALNDGQAGEPYPFQGYSYCLVSQLRQKFGSKAIEEVKHEKTHQRKHWMTAILDRQNEFRSMLGTEPLLLIKELTDSAQEHADRLARECHMHAGRLDDRGRRWNGNVTGESLAAGPSMPKEDAALLAANSWGSSPDKRGHFTQTVWNNTKYVGYGYGFNENCSGHKWYIVARYAGNPQGQFRPREPYPERQRIRYYEYYTRK